MPPIEPSLRASLLTGASAIAMSISASGVYAQTASRPVAPPTMTFWLEGALAYTGGGSFNIPSLPGLTAPFTSFNPRSGPEGAFGFDYRFQNQPWHFVFDFRFGRSGTSTANSASSSSSHTHSFQTFSTGPLLTQTIDTTTANSSATQASHREQHLVADFMIGRDLGVGTNAAEFQFGFRIADLRASAQAQQSGQSTTTTTTTQTFYSPTLGLTHPARASLGPVTTTSSSSSASYATWNSRFFGAGPRLAVVGSAPIVGLWSFDYGAGIAGLVADRSFDVRVWNNPGTIFGANFPSRDFVFNADAMLALSYRFTPNYKLTAGLRADFYDAALTTYNVSTGGLTNVNRIYWGPFARLTGSF